MCRKVFYKIIITVLLFIFLFNTNLYAIQQPIPNIKASSAILIESTSSQILYDKQPDLKLHSSVACKIMTTILSIENAKLDAKITASNESSSIVGAQLSLEAGEKYSVEDLLYATMLTTANDAAHTLAEYVGGDIDKFVEMMNKKAKDLKMDNTLFINPTGLFDESQCTTASDLANLIKYALNNPTFNKIFSTKVKPWINGNTTSLLISQNKLFWSYDGVDGGKIGYNDVTLQSSATTATKNNMRLIAVVLDSPEEYIFKDITQILDYGFNNYKTGILVQKEIPLKSIEIEDTLLNLISLNDVYYTFPVGEDYIKSVQFIIQPNLTLPVTSSKSIGSVRYSLMDNTIVDVSLYPDKDILKPKDLFTVALDRIKENKDILYLLIFLTLVEFILVIFKLINVFKKKLITKE